MKQILLTISLIFAVTSASSAVFVLKEEQKNAYVVGAIDLMTLSMFQMPPKDKVTEEQKAWNQCLRDSFDNYSTKIVQLVDQKYNELEPTEWVTPSYLLFLVLSDYCSFDKPKQ